MFNNSQISFILKFKDLVSFHSSNFVLITSLLNKCSFENENETHNFVMKSSEKMKF